MDAGDAGVAKALKHIGDEVSECLLSPCEKVRVGGVLWLSLLQK